MNKSISYLDISLKLGGSFSLFLLIIEKIKLNNNNRKFILGTPERGRLNISESTFYKYISLLKQHGIISSISPRSKSYKLNPNIKIVDC